MTAVELKELRLQLKISLLEIAAHSGLPQDYIAQIERGSVRASSCDLERIERALKLIEKESSQPDDEDGVIL